MTVSSNSDVQVAIIGQGVMGHNLALNFSSHGYSVAVFDLDDSLAKATETAALSQQLPGTVNVASDLAQLLSISQQPRRIVLSVPAGKAVDSICDSLLDSGLQPQDIVIDTGNCHWNDTLARQQRYHSKFHFIASAISGGEVGARHGPSLMVSGDSNAWDQIATMWQTIAAQVDADSGQPLPPHSKRSNRHACADYVGPYGSGHFVKTIHNGIEYAQMQMWAEAYQLLRQHGQMDNFAIAAVFRDWQQGQLHSYLLECTIAVLEAMDGHSQQPLLPLIVDAAGQKGTGTWTTIASLELGVAAPSLASAVYARAISSQRALRQALHGNLASPAQPAVELAQLERFQSALEQTLIGTTLANYAQGFELMAAQAQQQQWPLDLVTIAKLWRAGCIIRTPLLQQFVNAFSANPKAHLFSDHTIQQQLEATLPLWRRCLIDGIASGVALPVLSSGLAYVDGLRCADSPANLLQGMRDYFGAHRFERHDASQGTLFHHPWHDS
ncbi:NADP-dependent phosphogluconate dehydrogenase [Ferrimonas lipolytica]|uniref:6-phosphogluconate dehydrogenase, decarboxylating n=1 Tax=Ferrimonas lipolytica TaxID=2724191 RepID=A0A6H1UDQ6_9GAMM|nr:NADP-dependent phosphogluconate dehydrogenase [Ferrimonas lipolytica]QIZ77211.1 NADP-dependent phosphogluconate dehydrogenase [Ferrimonas lipolytica]